MLATPSSPTGPTPVSHADRGHEVCLQRKTANLANLEKSVVWSVLFRGKYESRAIGVFHIGVAVKCQMQNVVLVERQTLELRFRCGASQEHRIWLWKIRRDRFDFMSAFRQGNQFTSLLDPKRHAECQRIGSSSAG